MTRILGHVKSNAIAYVALFVALGGTSYAAIRIPNGSVGNRQLKNHSITPIKLDPSTIAGYVRDYAEVNAQGQIVASRPRASVISWQTSGAAPGGLIQWSQPVPASCFAVATTTLSPGGVVSYASAEVASGGSTGNGQTAVLLSTGGRPVNVAVICPQP